MHDASRVVSMRNNTIAVRSSVTCAHNQRIDSEFRNNTNLETKHLSRKADVDPPFWQMIIDGNIYNGHKTTAMYLGPSHLDAQSRNFNRILQRHKQHHQENKFIRIKWQKNEL